MGRRRKGELERVFGRRKREDREETMDVHHKLCRPCKRTVDAEKGGMIVRIVSAEWKEERWSEEQRRGGRREGGGMLSSRKV